MRARAHVRASVHSLEVTISTNVIKTWCTNLVLRVARQVSYPEILLKNISKLQVIILTH